MTEEQLKNSLARIQERDRIHGILIDEVDRLHDKVEKLFNRPFGFLFVGKYLLMSKTILQLWDKIFKDLI